jgi:hypothetical protein
MHLPDIPNADFRKSSVLLLPAAILAIGFGLFVNGYWLIDVLPASSRLLVALTGLVMAAGAAGFYTLLRWMWPRLMVLPVASMAGALGAGIVVGLALFFGGTAQWLLPSRYVSLLLPTHRLAVTALPDSAKPGTALTWFNTSLGDVSYDALSYTGWKRIGDQLVLQDPGNNSLEWSGRTGAEAQLVFHQSGSQILLVSWDGKTERLGPNTGKPAYLHSFEIPWYASGGLVLAAGSLVSIFLALALVLFLWEAKDLILPAVEAALRPAAGGLIRRDFLILIGSMILASLLRLPNLGGSYPAVDEYYHLIAARQIVQGAPLSSVYERGLWMVTIPVSLFLRVFGDQLWAARLPGLLVNVLAIHPLYLLARKINWQIAALAAVLYAASPWVVTFARIVREYAYYPLFFFWIVLGLIEFISAIPQGFVLSRDWRRIFSRKTVLLGLALLLPPLFAFFGDRLSTFRTILIAYPVVALFVLARFDIKNRSNLPFLGALGAGLGAAFLGLYASQTSRIVSYPAYNPVPVLYFLPDPQQQWYYGRVVLLVVLALLAAAGWACLVRRFNFIPLLFAALVVEYEGCFALLSKTFFHTRHVLVTELWYIILISIGLFLLWRVLTVLNPWKRRSASLLLAAALGLSVINVPQILVPLTSSNPDNPISEDYLHNMSQVHAYMLVHVQPQEVLISTVYGLYSAWKEAPRFAAQYRITTETPSGQISALIDQHEAGWIVIDKIRLSMSTLGPREFAGNPDVEYIGLFGDEYVWHWRHAAQGLGDLAAARKY